MRACDIKEGEVYKIKNQKKYNLVKVYKVLPPKSKVFYKGFDNKFHNDENPNPYILVKVLHSSNNNFTCGIIRFFRPRELDVFLTKI